MNTSHERHTSTLELPEFISRYVCCYRQMLAAIGCPTTMSVTGSCALLALAYPMRLQTSVSCETLALLLHWICAPAHKLESIFGSRAGAHGMFFIL